MSLYRLHHAAQTIQAKADFERLQEIARTRGRLDLAALQCPMGSWKRIDKAIAQIRTELGITLDEWTKTYEQ